MRTFLALVSTQTRLDPELLERIRPVAARSLPFRHMPYVSASWQSDDGRMAVFVWDNDIERAKTEPPLHIADREATTLYGYISHPAVPRPRDPATLALTLLDGKPGAEGLGGMFAICRADATRGITTVWKSASIAVPVFWTEMPGFHAIGTRALMLSLLQSKQAAPEYDLETLVPFLARGRFTSGRTPFRDVEVLPPNTKLTASAGGISLTPIDDFENECGSIEPSPGDYDILTELLLAGVRPFRGQRVTCNLTGGKDSRLVAAALRQGGVELKAQTNGFPDSRDVVVGRLVAAALGIPHHVSSGRNAAHTGDAAVTVDVHHRTRRALFGADGMLSAYEHLSPGVRFSALPLAAGGHGGEVALRDSFGAGGLSWDEAVAVLLHYYMPPTSLFLPGMLTSHRSTLIDWMKNARDQGMSPTVALDLYGYRFDLGVSGVGPIVSEINRYGLYPLMDNQVVKAGLLTRASIKISDEVVVNLLRRLEPALIDVPLAHKRWNYEQFGPLPGDTDGWMRRTPINTPAGSRGAFNWRHHWSRELWAVFIEQIFGDTRAHALFDVLDRDALWHWMTRRRGTVDSQSAAFAWAVFSATVLLSNDWLGDQTVSSNVLTIPVPTAA